jgi:hypothetical protein
MDIMTGIAAYRGYFLLWYCLGGASVQIVAGAEHVLVTGIAGHV